MPNAELTEKQAWMKEQMKDVCYWYQTHINHPTCPGAVDGACPKTHYYCKDLTEFRYVPVPASMLKNWADNGAALKAAGVTTKNPHNIVNAQASKGKYDGKGKEKGKGKDGKGKDDKGKARVKEKAKTRVKMG